MEQPSRIRQFFIKTLKLRQIFIMEFLLRNQSSIKDDLQKTSSSISRKPASLLWILLNELLFLFGNVV